MFDQTARNICLFAAGLTFLTAFGQFALPRKRVHNLVTAVVMLISGLYLISIGLGKDYILAHFPYLHFVIVPFYFILGPIFRSYLLGVLEGRGETGEEIILRFPGYATFTPFVIALLIQFPYFLAPPVIKREVMYPTGENRFFLIYFYILYGTVVVGLSSVVYYTITTLRKLNLINLIRTDRKNPLLRQLRFIALSLGILAFMGIFGQILDYVEIKRYLATGVSLLVIWLFLLDQRYPGFFRHLDREFRAAGRYKKSYIDGLNVPSIISRLERLMELERLYVDDDLSLERLATILEITPRQLSELLNNVIGTDFRSFLNRYRIIEARRLLLESPGRSIISIGFDVGFNSKASFNRNFKEITGQTPAEFRRQHHTPGGRRNDQ